MPNFGMFPQTGVLLATTTVTASATSAAIQLPPAQSYRIIAQVGTVSGTSPTMYVELCTSFDAGATYNCIMSSGSLTASGLGWQWVIKPFQGAGEAATSAVSSVTGTADLGTSVGIINGPINPQFIKIRYVVTGTSPSFALTVQYCCFVQDLSD